MHLLSEHIAAVIKHIAKKLLTCRYSYLHLARHYKTKCDFNSCPDKLNTAPEACTLATAPSGEKSHKREDRLQTGSAAMRAIIGLSSYHDPQPEVAEAEPRRARAVGKEHFSVGPLEDLPL